MDVQQTPPAALARADDNQQQTTGHTVYPHESEFVRLADIFEAAGIHVELLKPFPPLPDPESPRERYRRETIERAQMDMDGDE